EVQALGVEVGQEPDKALQRPTQAIDAPGGHDVEVFASDAGMECGEARPAVLALSAGDAFGGEGRRGLPGVPLCGALKLSALVVDRLVVSADPRVEGNPLHFGLHRAIGCRSMPVRKSASSVCGL